MVADSPGRAALAEQLRSQFGETVGTPHVRFEIENIQVDGDLGRVTYRETGHRVVERAGVRRTRRTERATWRRTPDGWRETGREHLDGDPRR